MSITCKGPKEYFQAGRIAFLPHNVYTNMPFNVEMLHLLAMEVMGDWWWGGLAGQLLVAFFGPAAAVLIAGTAIRAGSPRAGWIAALVYLSTPWVYRLAAIAYVEGPLCYYHAALIWAAFRGRGAEGGRSRRFWGLLGLLAGCGMGCKYTGLVSAVIPFGLFSLWDSWRKRSPALLGVYVIGWAIVMVPWLAKNVADTRNPVYPLAGRIFPSPLWDPGREAKWQAAHGPRPIDLRESWTSLVRLVRPRERKPGWFKVQREREPESEKEPREVEPESFKVPRELSARSLMWPDARIGSRRFTWRFTLAISVRDRGGWLSGSGRLRPTSSSRGGSRPTGSIDSGCRSFRPWRFSRAWAPFGPRPKPVDLVRNRDRSRAPYKSDLRHNGACRALTYGRAIWSFFARTFPALECRDGADGRRAAFRCETADGRPGGGVPSQPQCCL